VPRIFAAVTCGHEHVAAEALRLLTRLWAPGSARSGAGPWVLPRPAAPGRGAGQAGSGGEDPGDALAMMSSYDIAAMGRQAKSACLSPGGRCAPVALNIQKSSES
jgi:DnaJ family protein C protein 13